MRTLPGMVVAVTLLASCGGSKSTAAKVAGAVTTIATGASSDDGVLTDAELASYKVYVATSVTDELQRKFVAEKLTDSASTWAPVIVGLCKLVDTDPLVTKNDLIATSMGKDGTAAEGYASAVVQTQLAVNYVCSHLRDKFVKLVSK